MRCRIIIRYGSQFRVVGPENIGTGGIYPIRKHHLREILLRGNYKVLRQVLGDATERFDAIYSKRQATICAPCPSVNVHGVIRPYNRSFDFMNSVLCRNVRIPGSAHTQKRIAGLIIRYGDFKPIGHPENQASG